MSAPYPVTIRGATRDDVPLIMDSWLSCMRKAPAVRGVEGPLLYREHRRIVETLLRRAFVLVACDTQAPSSVFGWCCAEVIDNAVVVHFVWVRAGFQDLGIGSGLVREVLEAEDAPNALLWTHETQAGNSWGRKMGPRLDIPSGYNPYLLYRSLGAAW